MKVEIIQICNNNGTWIEVGAKDKPIIKYCGYLEVEAFNAEKCWDLCNWSCWADDKPKEVEHTSLSFCNSDVAFFNPTTNIWHISDNIGFVKTKDKNEAIKIMKVKHGINS